MDMYSFEFKEDEKIQEKILKHKCPVCLSDDIKDISTYKSNGVIGSGSASWKTSDLRACNNCGVVFQPTKGNTID